MHPQGGEKFSGRDLHEIGLFVSAHQVDEKPIFAPRFILLVDGNTKQTWSSRDLSLGLETSRDPFLQVLVSVLVLDIKVLVLVLVLNLRVLVLVLVLEPQSLGLGLVLGTSESWS